MLNAFQIKILMALLMLLDHLSYINNFIPSDIVSIFTIISRCVAPMFAYLAVEGIRNTHNLKKYCLRLSLFACVTFAGNKILNAIFESMLNPEQILLFRNDNVIFTLALGVIVIAFIQWGKDKKIIERICLYAISMLCFIIGFLWGEWGTVILPFIFIEYFFRDKKVIRFLGYILIEVFAILLPFGEPFYFLVFPFILLYNGERGPKTNFSKYFFYIFYPVLWIIAIINFMVIG